MVNISASSIGGLMLGERKHLRRSQELTTLSRYEEGALHSSIDVARWLAAFYADTHALFLNNVTGTGPIDDLKKTITPNAATNLLILSFSRLQIYADLGLEAEYKTVNECVEKAREKLPSHPPQNFCHLIALGFCLFLPRPTC
jgi:hypothetical protein